MCGVLMVLACLPGCAIAAASSNAQAPSGPITEALAVPVGTRVRWGGVISHVRPGGVGTLIQVAGHPLDSTTRPDLSAPALGRFLVQVSSPRDARYRPGRIMTVTGVLLGQAQGDGAILPLVRSQYRDLWPGIAVAAAPSYPPAPPPAPVYGPYRHHGRVLPLIVPLVIAGALVADHGHVYIGGGYGYRRGYGHHWRAWPHGHGHWRGHRRHHRRSHRGHSSLSLRLHF